MYNFLLGIQWALFGIGLIAAAPLYFLFGPVETMLSLSVGLLALVNLKLDVVSLAR